MVGLAADHAAQSHIAVIARGRREPPGLLGQGNCGRNLQGTGNRNDVEVSATRTQGVLRPFQKGVGQVVIEARLDDEDAPGIAYDWSSPSMSRQPTMRRP